MVIAPDGQRETTPKYKARIPPDEPEMRVQLPPFPFLGEGIMYGRFEYCVRCGRRLRDDASRQLGMGPKCTKRPGSKRILAMLSKIIQPELFEDADGRTEENA
jgi:hypothetical protein